MILEVYDKKLNKSILSKEVVDLPKKVIVERDGVFKESGKRADRIVNLITEILLKLEGGGKFIDFRSPKVFDHACHSNTYYVGVKI